MVPAHDADDVDVRPRPRNLTFDQLAAAILAGRIHGVVACLACSVVVGQFVLLGTGRRWWPLDRRARREGLLFLAARRWCRLPFGAAIMLSAPALVAYLLLPTAWDALVSTIHGSSRTLDHWLAIGTVLGPLAEHSSSATDWAHAGTTIALGWCSPARDRGWCFAHCDVNRRTVRTALGWIRAVYDDLQPPSRPEETKAKEKEGQRDEGRRDDRL